MFRFASCVLRPFDGGRHDSSDGVVSFFGGHDFSEDAFLSGSQKKIGVRLHEGERGLGGSWTGQCI